MVRDKYYLFPLRAGRRGTELLPVILETHNPIDIVILMLGTNDCKSYYGASAEVIGLGIRQLIQQIKAGVPDAKHFLFPFTSSAYFFQQTFHFLNAFFLRRNNCLQVGDQFRADIKMQGIFGHADGTLMMRDHLDNKIRGNAVCQPGIGHAVDHFI